MSGWQPAHADRAKPGEAAAKIDAYGVEQVCEDIVNGRGLKLIAKDIGVNISTFLAWIAADEVRATQVREARAESAKLWDEKAEEVLRDAPDVFGLAKGKELAHHYRWRAKCIAPLEYGDRQTLDHQGKIGLESLIAGAGSTPSE